MHKSSVGKSSSMPAGIGAGIGVSLLTSILGAMVLAWLIAFEKVAQNALGYGCMIILVLSSMIGCIVSWRAVRHRRLLVNGITILGYYVSLAVIALAFGGIYQGMGVTALMILLGGGIAQIPALFSGGSGAHRAKYPAYR